MTREKNYQTFASKKKVLNQSSPEKSIIVEPEISLKRESKIDLLLFLNVFLRQRST